MIHYNNRNTPEDGRLFPPLSSECAAVLDSIFSSVNSALPINARFARRLPEDIAQLSRLLTFERAGLHDAYLSSDANLSAYCRYFLPWNVWRLCRLFSSTQAAKQIEMLLLNAPFYDTLKQPHNSQTHALKSNALQTRTPHSLFKPDSGSVPPLQEAATGGQAVLDILDIGSGPLTLPAAIWAAFPALRKKALAIYAVDKNKKALEAGVSIFKALGGGASMWNIKTQTARLEKQLRLPPARLVSVVNVFNELLIHIPQADTGALMEAARRFAALLIQRTAQEGAVFIVEPGVPRSAQFLSLLRRAFDERGWQPVLPCPCGASCAMPGGKPGSKWCHWTLDTKDAPEKLKQISAAAGLAKQNAMFSFLLFKEKSGASNSSALNVGASNSGASNSGASTKGASANGASNKGASKSGVSTKTDSAGSQKKVMTVRVISNPIKLKDGLFGRYGCSQAGLTLLCGGINKLKALGSGTLYTAYCQKTDGEARRDNKSGALIINL